LPMAYGLYGCASPPLEKIFTYFTVESWLFTADDAQPDAVV
jgi:hypothetical protein